MRGGESGLPDERVRQALAQLGADSASAPDVPPSVTARIGAALRAAPPPAHTTAPPRLTRPRVIMLVIGVGALMAAITVGMVVLSHSSTAPRFPSGPTAERITVSRAPADTPNTVVTRR